MTRHAAAPGGLRAAIERESRRSAWAFAGLRLADLPLRRAELARAGELLLDRVPAPKAAPLVADHARATLGLCVCGALLAAGWRLVPALGTTVEFVRGGERLALLSWLRALEAGTRSRDAWRSELGRLGLGRVDLGDAGIAAARPRAV
jgi:hypothetical protein